MTSADIARQISRACALEVHKDDRRANRIIAWACALAFLGFLATEFLT